MQINSITTLLRHPIDRILFYRLNRLGETLDARWDSYEELRRADDEHAGRIRARLQRAYVSYGKYQRLCRSLIACLVILGVFAATLSAIVGRGTLSGAVTLGWGV